MTASHMLWPKLDGEPYEYRDGTPVSRRTYRCKATAQEAEKLGHTHLCKLTVDHDAEGHACICGKKWEPVPA